MSSDFRCMQRKALTVKHQTHESIALALINSISKFPKPSRVNNKESFADCTREHNQLSSCNRREFEGKLYFRTSESNVKYLWMKLDNPKSDFVVGTFQKRRIRKGSTEVYNLIFHHWCLRCVSIFPFHLIALLQILTLVVYGPTEKENEISTRLDSHVNNISSKWK